VNDLALVGKALELHALVIEALALHELNPSEHRIEDYGDGLECLSCGELPDGERLCSVMAWRARAIAAVT